MQLTSGKMYLECQYFPFTQPVHVIDLWNQLGFLVIKILGGDSNSLYTLIKHKESLSPPFSQYLKQSGRSPQRDTYATIIL
jgi:hypothetical protein